MLYKANTIKGYKLHSLDGEIGKVSDFFFDDQHWAIRYLVANTGNWLKERQVLISPYALGNVLKEEEQIIINLTKKQIEYSPALSSDLPVSQQFEHSYYTYYGWPLYWSDSYMWGSYPYIERDREKWKDSSNEEKSWDPHLRSINNVSDYYIQATDGEIGHVDNFIVDDETWAIRYLIINTHNWWPGKKVLVSPRWINRVSWEKSSIFVNIPREAIKQSPEYTEEALLTCDYENELHQHYNRYGYLVDESPVAGRNKP